MVRPKGEAGELTCDGDFLAFGIQYEKVLRVRQKFPDEERTGSRVKM